MTFTISEGSSRYSTNWKPVSYDWPGFVDRLREQTKTTPETAAAYAQMTKTQRDGVKDCGGFVGGTLTAPRRKKGNVKDRQLLTLDVDHAVPGFTADLITELPHAWAAYSTHSHTAEHPRYRLLIPLDRAVSPDEHNAIARKVCERLGMQLFDGGTFDAERLMYWPSHGVDAPFEFEVSPLSGPLSADKVLASYESDWRDVRNLPLHPREVKITEYVSRQQDPAEKTGIVGAFCRTYTIPEAIEQFLSDIYTPAGTDRFTYAGGTSVGGLTVHDNGAFAYSYHDTDPAADGHCHNAFDLVRIHKYGPLDDEAKPNTPANRLPSFTAMTEMASADPETRITLANEQMDAAASMFEPIDVTASPDDPDAWKAKIMRDKNGQALNLHRNIHYIMQHDPLLRGAIVYNEFARSVVSIGDLPWRKTADRTAGDIWRNDDDTKLMRYMEGYSMRFSKQNIIDQVTDVATTHLMHPVRDYLEGLTWDGEQRVDRLLIDRLNADDSAYVRTVTRKTLVGAVARIMQPGCKFDYMLVLTGPQGIGKSSIWRDLARSWFTDTVYNIGSKEAAEQLQGYWIVEMAELSAMRKLEVEQMKAFITTQCDSYRAPYATRVESRPRQCIFVGTTNSTAFLKDETGNRRFWPVHVDGPYKRLTGTEIDQIWAEAVQLYKAGEKLYLEDKGMEAEAVLQQEAYTIEDPWAAAFAEYLDRPIPIDWYERTEDERRMWLDLGGTGLEDETMLRDRVTAAELWTECLHGSPRDIKKNMGQIHASMSLVPGWERSAGKVKIGGRAVRAYIRTLKGGLPS